MALVGSNNEEKIWNYLNANLKNAYGVAGIMGNMKAESNLKPDNLQNTFETKLGYTDASYTKAVDSGKYTDFVYDKAGYGLVQWTYWSLKRDLYNYVKSKGKSIGDLETQLEFLCKQLRENYISVWNTCKNATSVREASDAMLLKFERPADQSIAVQKRRASYGQAIYNKHAKHIVGTYLPATPFKVKVLSNDWNIRTEGSMSGKIVGQTGQGTFTIIDVNSDGWGKLKSGAGWIFLRNPAFVTIMS